MWLSVATWRDICYYMVQNSAYTGFLKNDTRISAYGPTELAWERKRKRVDDNFIKACKQVYEDSNADFEAELQLDEHEGRHFLPNKQSRHRVTEVDSPPPVKKCKRD